MNENKGKTSPAAEVK